MKDERYGLVLAFYPNARGFAYVIFEGPHSPVDWGMSDLPRKRKTAACVRRLTCLLGQYHPDALVLRKLPERRGATREGSLLQALETVAENAGVAPTVVSRQQIKTTYAYLGSPRRYAIAEEISKHITALAPLLPPIRKIWNGEDRRMGLFDAAALGLTYWSLESGSRP